MFCMFLHGDKTSGVNMSESMAFESLVERLDKRFFDLRIDINHTTESLDILEA